MLSVHYRKAGIINHVPARTKPQTTRSAHPVRPRLGCKNLTVGVIAPAVSQGRPSHCHGFGCRIIVT